MRWGAFDCGLSISIYGRSLQPCHEMLKNLHLKLMTTDVSEAFSHKVLSNLT